MAKYEIIPSIINDRVYDDQMDVAHKLDILYLFSLWVYTLFINCRTKMLLICVVTFKSHLPNVVIQIFICLILSGEFIFAFY